MIAFLKKNNTFLKIIVIFALFIGWISVVNIPKEVTPSIDIPNYIITLVYPGADPKLLDEQVVSKLEPKLRSISLVNKVTASSSFNIGVINVEFSETKNNLDAINDIKAVIDQIYPTLPSEVRYPTVRKVDISDAPIYTFSVGWNTDLQTLYQAIKPLEDQIKSVAWVSDINVIGKPIQQISLLFDYDKLVQYNLDLTQIIGGLRTANFKISTDRKEIGGKLYTVELRNYGANIQDIVTAIENYDIFLRNGRSLKIKDVARVFNTLKGSDKESYIVKGFDPNNILRTLSFQIKKIPWADTQFITERVLELIENYKKQKPDLFFYETSSQKEQTDSIFQSFISNFSQTALQVFVVILLFLWLRAWFVSLIGFVTVYALTLAVLYYSGAAFNNITSFSLILVLGIMVDNIIIIVEWTIEKIRSGATNIWDAINHALQNYTIPVIMGTLTTVVVFVPILFSLKGIIGQFMKSFPITVNLNLMMSLFTTLVLLPAIIVSLIKPKQFMGEEQHHRVWKQTKNRSLYLMTVSIWPYYFRKFHIPRIYLFSLPYIQSSDAIKKVEQIGKRFALKFRWIAQSRMRLWSVTIWFWLFFISSFFLLIFGWLQVDFLWNSDSNNVWINVTYQPWISFDENKQVTYQVTKKLIEYLRDNDYLHGIESLSLDIWSQRVANSVAAAFGAWWWNFSLMSYTLRLHDSDKRVNGRKRNFKSFQLTERLQDFVNEDIKKQFPQVKDIFALTQRGGPWGWKPVGFQILWDDLQKMGAYVAQIMPSLQAVPEIFNISTSVDYTNGRFTYLIDERVTKDLGVNINAFFLMLSAIKNSAYEPNGVKITEFNDFTDDPLEVKSFVLYDDNLADVQVNNVFLDQITRSIRLEPELKSINRVDGLRTITVEADKLSSAPLGVITPQIQQIIKDNPLPPWIQFKNSADIETQSQSGKQLGNAFLFGIILMFLLLIFQFWNVKYPILILTGTLLSIAWWLYFLWILWFSFSFAAQLGMFGVIWVGVNQSIVLIDYLENLFASGEVKTVQEALEKAIERRFVPIFLTTLTSVSGIIAVIFSDEVFGSLWVTFAWWLLLSVFIGLWYVPSILMLLHTKEDERLFTEQKGE